jgi:ABC-type lipoprotein release transport system permease subunit
MKNMKNKYKQGGTGYLVKIAYRNIWRNKRRTTFVLAAVGISAFFFLVFMSMQDGIIRSMNDTVQIYETGHIKAVSAQYEAENENMPVQYPIGFMIINTVTMIIHERIKEIGMMGCLGMARAEIVKVFFFESLFLAAIGALFGVIAGGVLSGILSNFPIRLGDMYGNTLSEAPVSGTVFFRPSFIRILQAWLIGVVVASVFTLIPSLKSAFVEPVEALRK